MDDALWSFEEFPDERYAVLCRNTTPFTDLAHLSRENASMILRFSRAYAAWGLVVDMRQAQPRNDDGFEEAMKPLRTAADDRFARVVVLISSAAGLLQVKRLGATEHTDTITTRNEADAIQFAKDGTLPA